MHVDLLERVHDSIVLTQEENVHGRKRWMLIDLRERDTIREQEKTLWPIDMNLQGDFAKNFWSKRRSIERSESQVQTRS